MEKSIKDFDIIYISFDEPNAEENFRDLKSKFPHAKRVHGVKGFDAAHRTAAQKAETEFFFIIDGDNKITNDFQFESLGELNGDYVYSWSSKNIVNGLIYGNGGIKLWNKKLWQNMDCHDSGKGTDWCHQVPYFQMDNWYSYSYCNASPFQAFRTGFREGVKLVLDSEGKRDLDLIKDIENISAENLRRLLVWMSVGEDVQNGAYCIYGARLGFLKALCEKDFDINRISDYSWFEELWNGEFSFVRDGHYGEHYDQMAFDIQKITGLPISNLNSTQSELFKKLNRNPKRAGLMKEKGENPLVKNNFEEKKV